MPISRRLSKNGLASLTPNSFAFSIVNTPTYWSKMSNFVTFSTFCTIGKTTVRISWTSIIPPRQEVFLGLLKFWGLDLFCLLLSSWLCPKFCTLLNLLAQLELLFCCCLCSVPKFSTFFVKTLIVSWSVNKCSFESAWTEADSLLSFSAITAAVLSCSKFWGFFE